MKHIRYAGVAAIVALAMFHCATFHAVAQDRRALGVPVRDEDHKFQRYVTSWTAQRKQHVVLQRRDFSCGAAALATLMRYHWGDPHIGETRLLEETVRMLSPEEMKDRIKNGLSLTDLRRLAVQVGYNASIGEITFDKLSETKVPVIVGIIINDYDHFVVFRGTDGRYVYLADPSRGKIRVPIAVFLEQWQENLVLVVVPRTGNIERGSPLLVQYDESFLGEVNRLYLRDRVTDVNRGE